MYRDTKIMVVFSGREIYFPHNFLFFFGGERECYIQKLDLNALKQRAGINQTPCFKMISVY